MGGARYQANCLPGPWEPFRRDTADLAPGATDRMDGVLVSRSLTLRSTPLWAGGVRR